MRTPQPSSDPSATFRTTRWTLVVASRGDSPEARQALSDLCAAYYSPVVAFLRREGRDEDAARELAHEFFERVLERQAFEGADPQRGRFRSYLLGALKHFLSNRRAHESREKRGAGAIHEPLKNETDTSAGIPAAGVVPDGLDVIFDREWALSLLEKAFASLSHESSQSGSAREYEVLKAWLTGDNNSVSQADAARELGLSEGATRVAIHRLRRRFRELVKAEIAHTVSGPEQVADELRHLIAALSG